MNNEEIRNEAVELNDDDMDAVAGGQNYCPDGDRDDYWKAGETFAVPAYCHRCGREITNWRATMEIYGKVAICNHGSSMECSHYRRFIKSDGVTIEPFEGRLLGC